jgi:hypothetical protein
LTVNDGIAEYDEGNRREQQPGHIQQYAAARQRLTLSKDR